MKKIKQIINILFVYFSIHQTVLAVPDMQALKSIIQSIEKSSQDIVGGAVAIVYDGKVIYKKAFGHLKKGGALVNDQTFFALASVSKPIVSTAIATLVQKGEMDFEDTYGINGKPTPLNQILSHSTGYAFRGDQEIERGFSQKELNLYLKKHQSTLFKQSRPYAYSNFIYALSAQYAQGKGYNLDNLVSQLQCDFTLKPQSRNVVTPHDRTQRALQAPSKYQQTVPAAAGIYASLNGMIEFLHVILGNRPTLLSPQSLDRLFTPVAKAGDIYAWRRLPFKDSEVTSSYALGWRVLDLKGHKTSRLIFHSGSFNGATAFVGIIPDQQIGIVVLSNQSGPVPLISGLNLWKGIVELKN